MTVSVTHTKVSSIPDDPSVAAAGGVVPSDWNASHSFTMASGYLLGRSSVGAGAAEEITVGSGLTLSGGTLTASGSGVSSFSAGTTGFSPSTSTTGAITLSGTLNVANGGTGVTTSTGTGSVVLSASPSLTTPNLGTPSAATLTNATGLPVSTGISGLGTGVATALAVNTGSSGAVVVNGGALGTPSSGTVTNLTGTASININGTVGATTPTTGAFTTLSASSTVSGTGFSTYLASPPAIGGTTAAAGSFTTLSASSTVSGTGFSTYLASPPAIGGTTAAAGTFTTLSSTGDTTLGDSTADTVTINGTVQPGVVVSGTSSIAAFRITQLGSGNAILVEDDTNPDATPFAVIGDGSVLVGSTTQPAVGTVGSHKVTVIGSTAADSSFLLDRTDVSAGPATFTFGKTRGTDPLNSGDVIGRLEASGRDATAAGGGDERTPVARIEFSADAAAALDNMPGRITFQTTPSGSNTPSERMRIDNAGNVGIGATGSSVTAQTLTISKNVTGATSAFTLRARGQIQSDVTSQAIMVGTFPSTAAATFTLSNLYHFFASQNTIDVASTVTNQWGVVVANTLTGATNNYGINSAIASGTNRWNLYISGTAPNYMAGPVGIGATTTGDLLRIAGTISHSTTVNSQIIDNTVGSAVTSSYRGILSRPILQDASFTLSNLIHFYANPQTKPATPTITNQYGFFVESTATDATNNFGFYGNIASGANRWNLYMAGTAANYFAGSTYLAGTGGDQVLNVNGAVRVSAATSTNQTSAGTMDFTGGNMRFLVWGASGTQGNFTWWTGTGALGATQRMTLTGSNNLGLATSTFGTSATNTFSVFTGTAPTTGPADTVQFYSTDLSAGNTMPSFYTEGTNVGTGTPTADRTVAVRFNGTVYYLLASTIP